MGVSLEVSAERVRASIASALIWRQDFGSAYGMSCLVPLGNKLAMTANGLPYTFDTDLEAAPETVLDSWVSELRTWRPEGSPRDVIAACFPELGQVRWGHMMSVDRWTLALAQNAVGPHLTGPDGGYSDAGGSLIHPISVDASPAGQLYIVDGAHHRIVAVDTEGHYVTHWGSHGSADDQFDFGDSVRLDLGLNYAGSVVTDDEGYIYVADVFNGRIQVFAP